MSRQLTGSPTRNSRARTSSRSPARVARTNGASSPADEMGEDVRTEPLRDRVEGVPGGVERLASLADVVVLVAEVPHRPPSWHSRQSGKLRADVREDLPRSSRRKQTSVRACFLSADALQSPGMADVAALLADLDAESDVLDALVSGLSPEGWEHAHAVTGMDDRRPDRPPRLDRRHRDPRRHRPRGLPRRFGELSTTRPSNARAPRLLCCSGGVSAAERCTMRSSPSRPGRSCRGSARRWPPPRWPRRG